MTSKLAPKGSPEDIRLYARRWLLMAVFIFYTIACGVHWVEFSSINSIITRYYNVRAIWVEWTVLVFTVAYGIFVFPTVYIIDRLGVKGSLILVTLGVSAGSIIKCFSVSPDRFHLLMIGQTFEGVFQVFTFGLVGRFTALWFGSEEISRAGAFTLLGDQCGSALSFLIPSLLVQDVPNVEVVEHGMMEMHILFAVMSIMTLILVIFLFQDKPKVPPSYAQVKQSEEIQRVGKCIVRIFSKPSFLMMATSYGIAIATNITISTMLSQLIEINFKEDVQNAGKIGFTIMLSGMASSLVCSYILDRTRHFKGNAVVLSLGAAVSLTIFTIVLKLGNITLVYVAAILIGAFLQAYYTTGMQMGIELTFPTPESIVLSSLMIFVQLMSTGVTSLYGYVLKEYGDLAANSGLICLLIISFVFACLIPADLKRETIEKYGTDTELKEFISKS